MFTASTLNSFCFGTINTTIVRDQKPGGTESIEDPGSYERELKLLQSIKHFINFLEFLYKFTLSRYCCSTIDTIENRRRGSWYLTGIYHRYLELIIIFCTAVL